MFAEILVLHQGLVGRFERILLSMNETAYLLMHSIMAKCLMLTDKAHSDRLRQLVLTNELEQEFGNNFNQFLSQIGFDDLLKRSAIIEIFCAELFDGIGNIELPLSISNEASHHPNHMDMMFVVGMAKYRNAQRIFEFGTYLGRTTCGLAGVSERTKVFTLNLPPEADPRYGPYIGRLIEASSVKSRIEQIYCDSRKFDPKPYAHQMDFIFIDADHSYDGVKNDSEKSFTMLAPGGLVIWHDFAPKSPGVSRYLCELSKEKLLFRIRNTCLVVHIDGINSSTFVPTKIENVLEDAE